MAVAASTPRPNIACRTVSVCGSRLRTRAFGAYQEQLQAYVDQRTQLPPGGIKMAMPMTSAGIWLRNASTRLMTSGPLRGMIAKAAIQPDAISLAPYAEQITPARPSRG
jgi:hypothetical protein